MTTDQKPDQTTITLAAYALNLLPGAELAAFERENLLALAVHVGAKFGPSHLALADARDSLTAALRAKLQERDDLRVALAKCRDQFRRYEQLHALKPDGAGQEKAKVNGEFAEMCDRALRGA